MFVLAFLEYKEADVLGDLRSFLKFR